MPAHMPVEVVANEAMYICWIEQSLLLVLGCGNALMLVFESFDSRNASVIGAVPCTNKVSAKQVRTLVLGGTSMLQTASIISGCFPDSIVILTSHLQADLNYRLTWLINLLLQMLQKDLIAALSKRTKKVKN